MKMKSSTAHKIVKELINDLTGRQGVCAGYHEMTTEEQLEMESEWMGIIQMHSDYEAQDGMRIPKGAKRKRRTK